jgi:translation initiation factor 1
MAPNRKPSTGTVYSTDYGRMCPTCGEPVTSCGCNRKSRTLKNPPTQVQKVPNDGIVRVSRATKGRKGKGVTVITGLPLDDASLQTLAKQLKQKCGAGGAVKDGVIEVQGDHRDTLIDILHEQGYTVKRSGG